MGNICCSNRPAGGDSDFAKPLQQVTFGGGCFWCVEAAFLHTRGVVKCVSGYAGGDFDDPTYQDVKTGTTGHAEVVQVTYDPEVITFEEILTVYWKIHNPTTLNRQGGDKGTQYRSTIMYHAEW